MVAPQGPIGRFLEQLSTATTRWAGRSSAFACALAFIIVWLLTGLLWGFSSQWLAVINSGTTIVTFLMVFLIQRGQNKDALAIQLKLNEVVAALKGASNRLIGAEELTEHELEVLRRFYGELAAVTRREPDAAMSHSIEEATLDTDPSTPPLSAR
jgi:low affinity Fe/Cu permease